MCTRRMRSFLFYILLICAVTHNLAKNEEMSEKENLKLTEKNLEEEARKDIANLLKNVNQYTDDVNEKTQMKNIYELQSDNERHLKITPSSKVDLLDQVLKKVALKEKADKNEASVAKREFKFQFHPDNLTPAAKNLMQHLGNGPMKNLEPIKSREITNTPSHSIKNSQYEQLKQKFLLTREGSANKVPINRDKVKHHKNNYSKRVNYVDLKPEVYPELHTNISSEKNEFGNDEHDLVISNESDLKYKTKVSTPVIRTGNTLVYKNNDQLRKVLENFLGQRSRSHKHLRFGEDRLNSGNKVRSWNIDKKRVPKDRYNRKPSVLRTSDNNVDKFGAHVEYLNLNKKRDSRANTANSDSFSDILRSINNGKLEDLINKMDLEHRYDDNDTYEEENDSSDQTLRSLRKDNILALRERGARQGHHGSRNKRSTFTQAGYTQDPDTCKTYNENLVKLWANLSKFINVTEQPKERALHNIAMMIQAYLDHQNTKQRLPPDAYKVKHEGSRDKISEVILRIKKALDEGEGTPEKMKKMIIKYIKPFYGDVENEECQQVNEEFLGLSVGLLYKNYLENAECLNDGDGVARNKKNSLRKYSNKNIQPLSSNWHTSNSELKPDINSILIEDELYKDFHRGKMPRQLPTTKYRRRVFKRSKKHKHTSMYRSGDKNMNESNKLNTRSKISHSKRQKKNSLKTDLGKCERYSIRKLAVSLRPVIERFMGLLECQLDNTLRSINNDRISISPYLLYASKFYSNGEHRRHEMLPNIKITRKNTQRIKNMSPRKSQARNRYVNSDENDYDEDDDDYGNDDYNRLKRNDDSNSPWVRKYNIDKIPGMSSASPVVTSATDAAIDLRKSNSKNNNNDNNDYLTNYNEYVNTPPFYDNYDAIYKSHDPNTFPSLINPIMSVNYNKNTVDKVTNKIAAEPLKEQAKENGKEERNYGVFDEDFPEEPLYISNISDQQTAPKQTEVSGILNLKLGDNDQLIDADLPLSKNTVKSFESITEFLKKARDTSLQTPEFAVPFALDSNKGYVELTHLIKYPKILLYRPQFIVKNTMPYNDFLKTISNFNMTNDEVRLMKIVRHLPDRSVKVLFETEDFESPLEVRNIKDFRRRSITMPVIDYPLGNKKDTENVKRNANTDFIDEAYRESFINYREGMYNSGVDTLVKSDGSEIDIHSNSNMALNLDSDSVNSPPKSSSESSSSLGLPSLALGVMSKIPSLSSSLSGVGSAVVSAVGQAVESKIGSGLDTALNLGSALQLNPINPSHLGSYFSKILSSHSNSKSTSDSHSSSQSQSNVQSHEKSHSNSHSNFAFNSHSHSNSHLASLATNLGSMTLVPKRANKVPEIENYSPPSTQSTINRWWKKWKNIFKGKLKKIVKKIATLADSIDHIVKL